MYLQFFSIFVTTRFFSGVLVTHNAVSVFTTHVSKMNFVPCDHKSHIRMLPFYYESNDVPGGSLSRWYPSIESLSLFTVQPGFIRLLSCTCVGVRAFLARFATPSYILLWLDVTNPPLLQSSTCAINNPIPQPSQWWGRYGGLMRYQRNAASLHSCAPISATFTIDSAMEIHALIFFPRRRRRPSVR